MTQGLVLPVQEGAVSGIWRGLSGQDLLNLASNAEFRSGQVLEVIKDLFLGDLELAV